MLSGGARDQLEEPQSKPPVMLVVGEQEYGLYEGVPLAIKTHDLLQQRGFDSTILVTPENGHNIDQRTIEELARFVRKVTPGPVSQQKPKGFTPL